ncbi:uncharacterized protein LOC104414063 [Eucalyptus grandis]|uniref:uncharacterized protein LOC104414063 n=1 Tax=Eucalyptus grandis TaxID=71139 RepID=UPI00192E9C26|nr:uncharacterized protein LOC104414063 [Eucalyptus grandis]XP_039156848.1 uncharacterized protein LOC104414063 [Eucalyptus grandis]XP_039156849.1 uncharacterized protein LOC104414063 [Eucalyptus grandis]
MIPCTLGGVETLEELDASFCPYLMDEIPQKMWSLTRMRILDLDGSPISTVPRMINGFSSLQTLKIASCQLSPLPMLPSSLKCLVVAAAKFPVLPDLSNLVHLHHLEVRHLEVRRLHMTFWSPADITSPWEDVQSINRLPLSLSTLKLHSIPQLPDNFNFQSLSILSISKCLTAHLPDLSHLKGLQELRLSDFPELVEIPGLGELELLMFLHIAMCDVIKQLPNLSKLKNLLRLEVKHCAKLRAVEDLTELKILKNVEIRNCMSLEKLPDVSASTKLETEWTPPKPAEHTIQPAKRLRLSLD